MRQFELDFRPPPQPELLLTKDAIIDKAQKFAPIAAFALLIAFLAGFVVGPWLRGDGDTKLTVAIPPLPAVEPLLLKQVSREVAKKANDATPFTKTTIVAAQPFLFRGSSVEMARATDCLAAAIYYEAGAEAVQGQMAVVQVILNRARHPAYPKTVCGVVFQGQERSTGCQFSFTCDGSMARRPSPDMWRRFQALGRGMLNGMVYGPVGLATHYHTDWVLPVWSAKLDKIAVERTHLFFRYHGYWGSPAAFLGRTSSVEPQIAKLGLLSDVHRIDGVTPTEEVPLADPALSEAVLKGEAPAPANVATTVDEADANKDVFLIYVDPLLEADALAGVASRACGARKACKVLAWADPALMPYGLPISDHARAAMAYSYFRDKGTGAERSLWNCALFPRDKKAQCLKGT